MKRNAAILSVLPLAFGLIFAQVSFGQLESYSQTFEGLQIDDEAALADDGWLVGANVFDNGVFLYNYFGDENGPFPAPNIEDGAAFSSLATGAGGDNQGLQYLNVFSDYNNMDHGQGFLIDGSVYRNGIIGAADLNQTFRFEFDFRRGDDPFGPGGATTTNAFIRILSPAPDFFLIFEDTIDTTGATFDWVEGASLEFTVADDLEGFLFQVGFNSKATLFEPSGIYYDNISFGLPADCLVGDLNGDGMVTLLDVAPFVAAISDGQVSCPADINGDGMVDLLDVNPFILLLSGG